METKTKKGRPSKQDKAETEKSGTALRCPPRPKKRMPTKRVYICSPLKGNIEKNMLKAEIYCRFAFDEGYVPICPHIYYPRFLDDTDKDERAAGMRYGLECMWQARQLWVFGENITDGVREEIKLAKQLRIPVKYFDSDMEEIR